MRTAARSRGARRAAAGFTLVELMVALTVGGLAIGAIYTISAASTQQFFREQEIANAQTKLRMAIEMIKRDIARAGYLFTPRATLPGQSCGAPDPAFSTGGTNLAAFARFANDTAVAAVDPTGNNAANGATVDDITLMGNYATPNEYPGVALVNVATPNTVSFDVASLAAREDLTLWHEPPASSDWFSAAAFARTFPIGRLIRIRLTTGSYHYARVTARTVGNTATPVHPRVEFDPPIPAACLNAVANGTIAPIAAVRWFVRNAQANTAQDQRWQSFGPITELTRQEVLPQDKITRLADEDGDPATGDVGATLAIADYVVAFNLAFTMNPQAALPGQIVADSYAIGTTTNDPNTVNGGPERIRAVTIDLAVRTPEQDPGMPSVAAGNLFVPDPAVCGNLRCFQVFNDRPGAARVRRLRAEVFVPNVANEGF